jgi:uncharacterized protein YgiM (DUF1202 family)
MSRRYSSRRRSYGAHPIIGFLLIASFGILFVGCSGPEDHPEEELVFTQDDVTRYRDMADNVDDETGTGSSQSSLAPLSTGSGAADDVVLDLSNVNTYNTIRTGTAGAGNLYQVTNEFLNIRETPSTAGANLGRINFGQSVEMLEFKDAQWAKVKSGNIEGYVAQRYLAKLTSDERLEAEKKQFEGVYYVSFGFVNMRKEPNQASEKVGEIPGQTILKPISIEGAWAKVNFDGKDGYVSTSYIAPFMPAFIVRQETYALPVLHYRLTAGKEAELLQTLGQHINALRTAGYSFTTFREFHDLLERQQERDVRLEPNRVIVAVSGITAENYRSVSNALVTPGVPATLFLETNNVGLSGITEKNLLTLMANRFDIQSAGHTGDDLRALTDSQVELELKQSRKILEDATNKAVFAIAYPEGGVNDRITKMAAQAGYLLGLGDESKNSFNREEFLRMPGMVIFAGMTGEEIVEFVKGE